MPDRWRSDGGAGAAPDGGGERYVMAVALELEHVKGPVQEPAVVVREFEDQLRKVLRPLLVTIPAGRRDARLKVRAMRRV
jgi:hypothetical protein